MPAPPPRPPAKPPPNNMPNKPAPSMPPIRPERNGLRAMNPPDCGAVGAVAGFCACCCGVVLRSTGFAVGAVWVGAGAWSVWLPRLPELEPAPARASAKAGATMITAAITASQRIFFTLKSPLLGQANGCNVRPIAPPFKPSTAILLAHLRASRRLAVQKNHEKATVWRVREHPRRARP